MKTLLTIFGLLLAEVIHAANGSNTGSYGSVGSTGGGGGNPAAALTNANNTFTAANNFTTPQTEQYVAGGLPVPWELNVADSFNTNANGATLPNSTVWPDITGNGNGFIMTNAIVSLTGVYGKSALLGNGSSTIAISQNTLAASLNTNFTLEIKFYDPVKTDGLVMLESGSWSTFDMYVSPWRVLPGSDFGGGSVGINAQTNTVSLPGQIWNTTVSHTLIVRYNNVNCDTFIDGFKWQSSYAFGPTANGLGFTGNIFLWNIGSGGFAWPGDIREVVVWTNVLTDSQVWNQFQFDAAQDTQSPVFTINNIGTSIAWGWRASAGGYLANLLSLKFPNCKVNIGAISGAKSGAVSDNLTNNILPQPSPGLKIDLFESFGANDNANIPMANMLATNQIVETNLINCYNLAHAAHHLVVLWPPVSNNRETNGWVTNLWAWFSVNASSCSDVYLGTMTNAAYAAPGAYNNATYSPDGLHPSSLVYTDMVNTYITPAIMALAAGTNFSGTFTGNGSGLTGTAPTLTVGNATLAANVTAATLTNGLAAIGPISTTSTLSATNLLNYGGLTNNGVNPLGVDGTGTNWYVITNAFTASGNPTNGFTTNVLYTAPSQRSTLVGSFYFQTGVGAATAKINLTYTNNSIGYTIQCQAGGAVETNYIPFSVPLSTNATFEFLPTVGAAAVGYVTNVVDWLQ